MSWRVGNWVWQKLPGRPGRNYRIMLGSQRINGRKFPLANCEVSIVVLTSRKSKQMKTIHDSCNENSRLSEKVELFLRRIKSNQTNLTTNKRQRGTTCYLLCQQSNHKKNAVTLFTFRLRITFGLTVFSYHLQTISTRRFKFT